MAIQDNNNNPLPEYPQLAPLSDRENELFSAMGQAKQADTSSGDMGDAAKLAGASILDLPAQVAGFGDAVADFATTGASNRPFTQLGDSVANALPALDLDAKADKMRTELSPDFYAHQNRINTLDEEGAGALALTAEYLKNPAQIVNLAAQSTGSLVGTGGGGLLLKALPLANKLSTGARLFLSEGAIAGGAQNVDLAEADVDPYEASKAALGTAFTTGMLGRFGYGVSKRLGLGDPDVIFQNGVTKLAPGVKPRTLTRRVLGGAIAEGVFEELPQSVTEKMWSNHAQGEALFKGIDRAAVEGALAGSFVGGLFNVPSRQDVSPVNLTNSGSPDAPGVSGESTRKKFVVTELEDEQLLDAYSAMTVIAEGAAEDPELAERTLMRRSGIRKEMDKRGMDEGLVNEHEAGVRYSILHDQIETMRGEYREQVAGRKKGNAVGTSKKIAENLTRLKQLESAFPSAPAKARANHYNTLIETHITLTDELGKVKTPEGKKELRQALAANRQARTAHKKTYPTSSYTGADARVEGKKSTTKRDKKADTATAQADTQQTTGTGNTTAAVNDSGGAKVTAPAVEAPWIVTAMQNDELIPPEQLKRMVDVKGTKLLGGADKKKLNAFFDRVENAPIDEVMRLNANYENGTSNRSIVLRHVLEKRQQEVDGFEQWQAVNNEAPVDMDEMGLVMRDASLTEKQREILSEFMTEDSLRGQGLADIAKATGRDRKTVDEHFNNANPKLISELAARRGITTTEAAVALKGFFESYESRTVTTEVDREVEDIQADLAAAEESGDEQAVQQLKVEQAEATTREFAADASNLDESPESGELQAIDVLGEQAGAASEGASNLNAGAGVTRTVTGFQESNQSVPSQDIKLDTDLLGVDPDVLDGLADIRLELDEVKDKLKAVAKQQRNLTSLTAVLDRNQSTEQAKFSEGMWRLLHTLNNQTNNKLGLEYDIPWETIFNDAEHLPSWMKAVNEAKVVYGMRDKDFTLMTTQEQLMLLGHLARDVNLIGKELTGDDPTNTEYITTDYKLGELRFYNEHLQQVEANIKARYDVQAGPLDEALSRYVTANSGDPAAIAEAFGYTKNQIRKRLKFKTKAGDEKAAFTVEVDDAAEGEVVDTPAEVDPTEAEAAQSEAEDQLESAIEAEDVPVMDATEFLGEEAEAFELDDAGTDYNDDAIQMYDEAETGDFFQSVGRRKLGNRASSPAKIKSAIRSAFHMVSEEAFNDRITIVQDPAELALVVDTLSLELTADVQAFVAQGRVYMVAQNIPDGSELAVALHEIGVHLGLRNLLGGSQFVKLGSQIMDWSADSTNRSLEAQLARESMRRVEDAEQATFGDGKMFDHDTRIHEAIAYFVEQAVDMGVDPTAKAPPEDVRLHGIHAILRKIYAAFKQGLRRLRFAPNKLTAQNIVDLAYGGARFELSGSHHGTSADFKKFSHEYLLTGEGANAFSAGTYTAQRYGVARDYWDTMVKRANDKLNNPDTLTMAHGDWWYKIPALQTFIVNTAPMLAHELATNKDGGIRATVGEFLYAGEVTGLENWADAFSGRNAAAAMLQENAPELWAQLMSNTSSEAFVPMASDIAKQLQPTIKAAAVQLDASDTEATAQYELMIQALTRALPNWRPGVSRDAKARLWAGQKSYDEIIVDLEADPSKSETSIKVFAASWEAMVAADHEQDVNFHMTMSLTGFQATLMKVRHNPGQKNSEGLSAKLFELNAAEVERERTRLRMANDAAIDTLQSTLMNPTWRDAARDMVPQTESQPEAVQGQIKLVDTGLNKDNAMLWQQPWSANSEAVRRGMEAAWDEAYADAPFENERQAAKLLENHRLSMGDNASMRDVYKNLVDQVARGVGGRDSEGRVSRRSRGRAEYDTSQLLAKHGVLGNIFYDANSRRKKGVEPSTFTFLSEAYVKASADQFRISDAVESAAEAGDMDTVKGLMDEGSANDQFMQKLRKSMDKLLKQRRTVNYVNFVDKQALPLSSYHSADSARVMFSRRADRRMSDEYIDKLPPEPRYQARRLDKHVRKLGVMFKFTSDFVRTGEKVLPALRGFFAAQFEQMAERNQLEVAVQEVVDPVQRWTSKQRKQLNVFLARSTVAEKWGFDAQQYGLTDEDVEIDSELNGYWQKLNADQQDAAINMFRQAAQLRRDVNRDLSINAAEAFDKLIELNAADSQRVEEITAQRDGMMEAFRQRGEVNKPSYIPLKRFGKYALTFKSPAFLEAVGANDQKVIAEMKADSNHYRVQFFENHVEAQRQEDLWRNGNQTNATVSLFERLSIDNAQEMIPRGMMEAIRTQVESMQFDDGTGERNASASGISHAIEKLYISLLNEDSIRKSEIDRIGVAGFDEDMIRSYTQHARGMAAAIGSLRTQRTTAGSLHELKDQAREDGPDKGERMVLANEALERYAINLNSDAHPITDKIMGTTSLFMLLSSPAYYMQNATQPWMISLPVIGSDFGIAKTQAKMLASYSDAKAMWGKNLTGGELAVINEETVPDPHMRELLQRMQKQQLLDVGITADLGSFNSSKGVIGGMVAKLHNITISGVRTVELFNRVATAKTAYELHLDKHGDVEAAKAYAMDIVRDTQGDYSNLNAPRAFNKNQFLRVGTQFRKFQILQIGILTRAFKRILEGEGAVEKFLAGKQLAYILTTHGMVGGLMGLPAANLIGWAVASLGGEDDEPADIELMARRAIGNKEVSDLLLRGLPNAYLGVDATTKLGMGQTFAVMPFTDIKFTRDGTAVAMAALAGPAAAQAGQMVDGWGMLTEGNTLLGIANMLPRGVRDVMRAFHYANTGVTRRNATMDVAIRPDELSMLDIGMQGLGWPTTAISDRQAVSRWLKLTEETFDKRNDDIKRDFVRGRKAGDHGQMLTARQEWMKLQRVRMDYGFTPQSLKLLTDEVSRQQKREQSAQQTGGVYADESAKNFVRSLLDD
jgi:hypothetical protein